MIALERDKNCREIIQAKIDSGEIMVEEQKGDQAKATYVSYTYDKVYDQTVS